MTPTLELQDTIAVLNLGADENRFSPRLAGDRRRSAR